MKHILFTFSLLFTLTASATPKNLVYFIGDGMGPTVITGARIWKHGSQGRLYWESFTNTGFSKTFSSDNYVTDSAAGATALASGVKTYNGAIGVTDPKIDGGKSRNLQTIFDVAKKLGKSVGVITTTKITHATPACFYAHVPKRSMENEIAEQILTSDLSLIMGGGRKHFFPKGHKDEESGENSAREDSKNIVKELENNGWTYVKDLKGFKALNPKKNQKVIALFNNSHMEYEVDRASDKWGEPSLKEMVEFAIKKLSQNKKGFFLMVEAGRIDHAGHGNMARRAFGDVIALDEAVKQADDMTKDKDTLILITADHETGGLALSGYAPMNSTKDSQLLHNIKDETGERGLVSWASGPGGTSSTKVNIDEENFHHKAVYPAQSAFHTAVDVPVITKGPGSKRFTGYYLNNFIPWKILKVFGQSFTWKSNKELKDKFNQ